MCSSVVELEQNQFEELMNKNDTMKQSDQIKNNAFDKQQEILPLRNEHQYPRVMGDNATMVKMTPSKSPPPPPTKSRSTWTSHT